MGAGTLEESPLRTHHERKLVVSVRLDLPNLSDEVNYSVPTQIARQFAANQTLKEVFMTFTNMITHPESMSPVQDKCWSSLLIAFGGWTGNAQNEFFGLGYTNVSTGKKREMPGDTGRPVATWAPLSRCDDQECEESLPTL